MQVIPSIINALLIQVAWRNCRIHTKEKPCQMSVRALPGMFYQERCPQKSHRNSYQRETLLKAHNLILLPNKIRLNLINTFVMSRNKHISKKTRCFSRKRSKNKAKPNEFERRILKLSCYACSDNPI